MTLEKIPTESEVDEKISKSTGGGFHYTDNFTEYFFNTERNNSTLENCDIQLATETLLTDFEDQNINFKNPMWNNWELSTYSYNLKITNNFPYGVSPDKYGGWALRMEDNSSILRDEPTTNGIELTFGDLAGGTNNDKATFLMEIDGSGSIAELEFEQDGSGNKNIVFNNNFVENWQSDTLYDIKLIPDFSNNTVELFIDGTSKAEYEFYNIPYPDEINGWQMITVRVQDNFYPLLDNIKEINNNTTSNCIIYPTKKPDISSWNSVEYTTDTSNGGTVTTDVGIESKVDQRVDQFYKDVGEFSEGYYLDMSENSDGFDVYSDTLIPGPYGQMTANDDNITNYVSLLENSTTGFSFQFASNKTVSDSYSDMTISFINELNSNIEIVFPALGSESVDLNTNNDVATILNGWSENTVYNIDVEFDFPNSQLTVDINGNSATANVNSSINSVNKIKFYNDMYNVTESRDMAIANLYEKNAKPSFQLVQSDIPSGYDISSISNENNVMVRHNLSKSNSSDEPKVTDTKISWSK